MNAVHKVVVALVRHGAYQQPAGVPSAHLPYALTAEGRAQAQAAAVDIANWAAGQRLDICSVIDSSNLRRAWQTASLLVDALNTKEPESYRVEGFDELAERSLGCAANLTVMQIEQILASDPRFPVPPTGWKSDRHYCLPLQGAESLTQAGVRVAGHIRYRTPAPENTSAVGCLKVFVGHGAAFRHAVAELGILEPTQVDELSMFHCHPVFVEYRGHDQWVHVAGNWKIRAATDTPVD